MTDATADTVVVGGGVIGTSVAMHLARLGAGKVVLVEQGHLAGGASGRSGAMVREHYLHPVLVRMAMESSHIFHNFADAIGGDAGFRQTGRLLLVGERDKEAVRANVGMNRDLGVNIETVAPSELVRIVPNMNTDGVAISAYEPDSGYADPVATTYAYADRARDHGAEILTQRPVTRLATSGGRITGVETYAGLIAAPAVVVATGPWWDRLAASVGESLPITPIRVPGQAAVPGLRRRRLPGRLRCALRHDARRQTPSSTVPAPWRVSTGRLDSAGTGSSCLRWWGAWSPNWCCTARPRTIPSAGSAQPGSQRRSPGGRAAIPRRRSPVSAGEPSTNTRPSESPRPLRRQQRAPRFLCVRPALSGDPALTKAEAHRVSSCVSLFGMR